MPHRAPRPCGRHGCGKTTTQRFCDEHRQANERERGTSAERGYGYRWRQRRAAWLRAHPLCAHCEEHGIVKAATDVDHIIALRNGGADDESNYQSLCHECYSIKEAPENHRL